jgi:hypothetical protein
MQACGCLLRAQGRRTGGCFTCVAPGGKCCLPFCTVHSASVAQATGAFNSSAHAAAYMAVCVCFCSCAFAHSIFNDRLQRAGEQLAAEVAANDAAGAGPSVSFFSLIREGNLSRNQAATLFYQVCGECSRRCLCVWRLGAFELLPAMPQRMRSAADSGGSACHGVLNALAASEKQQSACARPSFSSHPMCCHAPPPPQ